MASAITLKLRYETGNRTRCSLRYIIDFYLSVEHRGKIEKWCSSLSEDVTHRPHLFTHFTNAHPCAHTRNGKK